MTESKPPPTLGVYQAAHAHGSACPACGTPEYRVLLVAGDRRLRTTTQQFHVVECNKCRLIRLEPQPTPGELRAYYPSNGDFPASEAAFEPSIKALFERLALRSRIRCVQRALRDSGESGLVLDVGCGDGRFLRLLAANGVERVAGLDFSLDAAAEAWRSQRVPVACATLSRAPFAAGSCSAITMFDVLQHLYHPIAFLDAARDLLAPEGRLIVQVPNAACWQFLIFGDRWSGLDIPRQLIHFKAADVEGLLGEAGFEVLRRQYFSLRDNPATLVSSMFPDMDPAARRIRRVEETSAARVWKDFAYYASFALATPFALLEAACQAGSTVTFEARKKR